MNMVLLSLLDPFFDYYHKSPRLITFFLLFSVGIALIAYSNAHKLSAAGVDLPASKSKKSNARKEIAFWLGVFFILCSGLVLLGIIPIRTTGLAPIPVIPNPPTVHIQKEIGGFGDLPIIRIPRNCFERPAHEYENYTLFAGNFRNEIDAMNRVSTLDAYNIKNVKWFEKQCDTIPMIAGEYFVFLGRKCTSLKSIQRYEMKYETMFKEDDFIDLKIIKWEKSQPIYSLYKNE